MTNIVQDIIPVIQEKATYFRKVRDDVYLTRCPWCGDSQTKLRNGHLYLLINGDRCTCYCQKCNANHQLTNETLQLFIGDHNFDLSGQRRRTLRMGNQDVDVETIIPGKSSGEYQYLKFRLGCDFTDDDLYRFRIIDQRKFIEDYQLRDISLVNKSITFITSEPVMLCHRNLTENDSWRWLKTKLQQSSSFSPYSIRSEFDLLSVEPMTIMIAEGIFDIIGVYKHITHDANMYLASLGKDHAKTVRWLITKGVFGKNISLQIYSDDDVTIQQLRRELRSFRWLYNEISVVYNNGSHDFGVHRDCILPQDPLLI